MKNLSEIGGILRTSAKTNSPLLLSVGAGIGLLATVYLTARATFKAAKVIKEDNTLKENAKLVWKLYIPPAISTVSSIGFIVGANRVDARKIAAAQTAFAVSQRTLSDYRDQVAKELGKRKDTAFRDNAVEERVAKQPPSATLISGPGNVVCCELFTMRYFTSDMETLKKAVNELNEKLLKRDYMTLDDFYYMIGLQPTTYSGQIGWKSDKLMELEFSTVMTPDGRPCLAFDYNYTKQL